MAKTNWKMGDTVQPADLNQIGEEINKNTADIENIQQELEHLDLSAENVTLDSPDFVSTNVKDGMQELFTNVSSGKQQLETAITDKGGTVSKQQPVPTFGELDEGIRSIPQAKGNAARTDVLAGKTFSSEVAGIEQEGTMPYRTGNVTGKSISRSGTTLRIKPQTGYVDDTSNVQWSDPNWIAGNIRQGVSIFGLSGNFNAKRWANGLNTNVSSYLEVRGLTFRPRVILSTTNTNSKIEYSSFYVDPSAYPSGSSRTIPINVAIGGTASGVTDIGEGRCDLYDDGFRIYRRGSSSSVSIWLAFE